MFRFILILFLGLLSINGFSQELNSTSSNTNRNKSLEKKTVNLISGLHINQYTFAEVGIGFMRHKIVGHHPSTLIYGISNELKLSQDFVWGFKAGVWVSNGMSAGLNLINYTNFNDNALYFRPEIGTGLGPFRLIYGYNLSLTDSTFNGINTHNISFQYLFNFKKKSK